MNTVRWGLIGCGDIARKRVVPAIQAIGNCQLQAVSRSRADLTESFAREYGFRRAYTDWQELLKDEEVDAVYIATPVYLHAEQTIAAAEAGKHVLCEKPMALNLKDCDSMIEACRANNVHFSVAYYRHFYPVIKRVKEIISSSEIGVPLIADIQAFEWFDRKEGEPRAWLLNKEKSGGGPMMDFGCHRIEVLQYLFGDVKEMDSQLYNLYFKQREVEDTAHLSLLFSQGVHANLQVSHGILESRDTLDIYGSLGSIHIPVLNQGTFIISTDQGKREEYLPPHSNVHQPLIENFIEAIIENKKPICDGLLSREVSRILDIVYA